MDDRRRPGVERRAGGTGLLSLHLPERGMPVPDWRLVVDLDEQHEHPAVDHRVRGDAGASHQHQQTVPRAVWLGW